MRPITLLLVALMLAAGCQDPTQPGNQNLPVQTSVNEGDDDHGGRVVRVAAPTGNPAIDVPNIEAAIAAATPGAVGAPTG